MIKLNALSAQLRRHLWQVWHAVYQIRLIYSVFSFRAGNKGKFISYVATAGMGNRLRAHLIALAIARRTGRQLLIHWARNSHCGAHYSDLYQPGAAAERGFFKSVAVLHYLKGVQRPQADRDLYYPQDLLVLDESWQFVDFEYLVESVRPLDLSTALVPVESIAVKIKDLWPLLGGRYIGMHVRRGDFVRLGHDTPLQRYRQALLQLPAEWVSKAIFIASDAKKSELAEVFQLKERELVTQEVGCRASLMGMQDAVLDLFLLANADYLILTRGSTFGELAALIGQKRFVFA